LHLAVLAIKKNMPLVIFPEGGRSETGHLQSFMGGAFFAAIKAQVDVVPMVLIGTYEILKMNTWHIKPRPIKLIVADPIPTTGLTSRDVEAVAQKARAAMADIYYRYSPLGYPGGNQKSNEPQSS
jgi:1-acyl-sn-glycerol-3-phosphate acyltransferase